MMSAGLGRGDNEIVEVFFNGSHSIRSRTRQHLPHPCKRHPEISEPTNHDRAVDLMSPIEAVPAHGIHVIGLQDSCVCIEAQSAGRQAGGPCEVSDHHQVVIMFCIRHAINRLPWGGVR